MHFSLNAIDKIVTNILIMAFKAQQMHRSILELFFLLHKNIWPICVINNNNLLRIENIF